MIYPLSYCLAPNDVSGSWLVAKFYKRISYVCIVLSIVDLLSSTLQTNVFFFLCTYIYKQTISWLSACRSSSIGASQILAITPRIMRRPNLRDTTLISNIYLFNCLILCNEGEKAVVYKKHERLGWVCCGYYNRTHVSI